MDITNIAKNGLSAVSAEVDGITFNNIPLSTKGVNGAAFWTQEDGPWNTKGTGIWRSAVNAVDIDWNNAKLGEEIINSTGKMLSYMSSIMTRIENLENALIGIND